MHADWAFRPSGLEELVERATVAVTATVERVSAGRPLAFDEPGEATAGIPTQRIRFVVDDRWRGSIPATFSLFKTGTTERWIENDPPYKVGERYVLFLVRRGDGTYVPAAPDGRLKIVDGRVRPFIGGTVGDILRGTTPSSAKQMSARSKAGK